MLLRHSNFKLIANNQQKNQLTGQPKLICNFAKLAINN